MKYVIIGMGAGGIGAMEVIRKNDPSGEITLVSEDTFGYYSRPGLAYYLTGEIPEKQLFPFSEEDFHRLRVKRFAGRAESIDRDGKTVRLASGQALAYDRLLIATGSAAVQVKVPGADLGGVVKLDNLDDAREIVKRSRRSKGVVIVGGGITALEIVEGLRARKVPAHYFLRGDRYWSNILDETESRLVESRLQHEGVKIHYQTELAEILGKNGQVRAVLTQDGREIPCDIVAVAIGVRPRAELGKSAGLNTDRGILVDETMRTSDPSIYAAGDVAQVYDPASGKWLGDTLWWIARDQGRCAGANMSGVPTVYVRPASFNVTRLAGLTTTIIGAIGRGPDADLVEIARGDSETWRELPDAIAVQNGFDVNWLRVQVGEKTLLGAIVMGDQTLSRPIQALVSRQVDITPIRDRLLKPEGDLGDLLIDFYTQWRRG